MRWLIELGGELVAVAATERRVDAHRLAVRRVLRRLVVSRSREWLVFVERRVGLGVCFGVLAPDGCQEAVELAGWACREVRREAAILLKGVN